MPHVRPDVCVLRGWVAAVSIATELASLRNTKLALFSILSIVLKSYVVPFGFACGHAATSQLFFAVSDTQYRQGDTVRVLF